MSLLPKNFDRVNAFTGLGVGLVALGVYLRTLAPTLSFWDCGEFIAASYIFGIPHPPGTPTYLVIGRLATLFPTFADISARVNLLSAVCSAAAAVFGYLVAVRVMRHWFTADRGPFSRLLIYGGAACGALLLALSRTQWNNSVETEVYGMSMMLIFGIAWLTLIYLDNRDSGIGEKLMLVAVFLAFLGIGVHMTTFLVFPVSAIVFILKKDTPLKVWFAVGAFFLIELFLIFALSARPGEIPYYFPVMVALPVLILYALSFDQIPRELLLTALGFFAICLPGLAALAGMSKTPWMVLGLIGLAATAGYAVYLIRAGTSRGAAAGSRQHALAAVAFVAAALVLSALVFSGLRGYRAFLLISVVLLATLGWMARRHVRFPVLVALIGPALIILGVREFFWGTLAAAGVLLLGGLFGRWAGWKTALMVVVVAALGYSTHAIIPVRSTLHPFINENKPGESLEATINFFERKQYGSESMVPRMFERRAEWANQFGDHIRMGFWGFFQEQYGTGARWFVPVFLLGLFGIWEACRRKAPMGVYLVILLLVTTVGLILYMNFADGQRRDPATGGDWLEVRDRDYFFTPGFMLFGLAIGLGATALIQFLRDMTARFHPLVRRVATIAPLVLFLLPLYALANNYYFCDRSRNYIPYDYARNMLISADPDAVLFTFGDNDTFPLWCAQEVYGIRKDVDLVCCALANGKWYIEQVRDYMGVNLGWSDADIDALRVFRTSDGRVFRLQDQVVDAAVAHNRGKRPINFSPIGGPPSRKVNGYNVDSMMVLRGMVFSLTDTVAPGLRIDSKRSLELLAGDDNFQYRGWNDPAIYKSEATERAINDVAEAFLLVAEHYLKQGKADSALLVTQLAAERIPSSSEVVESLAALYAETGDTSSLAAFGARHAGVDSLLVETLRGRAYYKAGAIDAGISILQNLLARHPGYREALNELMALLIERRDLGAMVDALRTWVTNNPRDEDVRKALEQLEAQLRQLRERSADSQ